MDESRQLATRFNHICFKHYYREANRCADGLAEKGATQSADFVLSNSRPQDLETSLSMILMACTLLDIVLLLCLIRSF